MSDITVSITYYTYQDGIFNSEVHPRPIRLSLTEMIKSYMLDEDHYLNALLDEEGSGTGNWGRWDDMEEDMRSVSLINPGTLFCVSVRNEDDEEWENYFHNGKRQFCDSWRVFEPFNPEKLK